MVDDHGWVAHHSGIAARDRIEVPRADRTLAVPGLGLCLPERIADGWLVRAVGSQRTLSARLDLTGTPVLELRSDGEPWRTTLTPRHAQIVDLLGRAGASRVTAAALSQGLYGDPDHVVSARAEVSRLRRVIGALVSTNPYRLAEGVELTVVRTPG
ncbi:hypothetical protein BH11ACT8_BH11ACT8_32530 [soil metagenome]